MKLVQFFIILFIYNAISLSQVTNDPLNFLLLSLDYSSNTKTFGVTTPEIKQPNFITSLSYISKHGFDFTYSGIITSNSDSSLNNPTSEHDIMLGYNIELSEDIKWYSAYAHLFHSKNSYSLKSAFTDIFQTELMIYKRYYNGSISLNYMLGSEKNMFFVSVQNALEFEFEKFIIKNSTLNLHLGVFVNYSDKNYYNESTFKSWNALSFMTWVSEIYPDDIRTILASIRKNGLETTKDEVIIRTNNEKPPLFSPVYAISSLDFYLPIYYSINNFMFNFTTYLNVPTVKSDFFELQQGLSVSFGISYALSFKK